MAGIAAKAISHCQYPASDLRFDAGNHDLVKLRIVLVSSSGFEK